jgi:hypothetical protein
MTGDIAAVTGGRIIGSGSRRISEAVLNYDIGRFGKVKMNGGPVGRAVVTNRTIALVPSLRVAIFTVRSDVSSKCSAIRRKVMA